MTSTPIQLERFEDCLSATLHPAIDPDAEALELAIQEKAEAEAQEQAKVAKIQALTSVLQHLPTQTAQTRKDAIRAVSDRITTSIASLMPTLSQCGFHAELSLAVNELIHEADLANAELFLPPEDYGLVVEMSASLNPSKPLKISEDEALATHTARLSWDGGGAEIAADALTERACALLERQIKFILGKEAGNV